MIWERLHDVSNAADFVALAVLADADLVDPPDFDPQGWPDTFNETYVRFTNRDRKFKEDAVAYRDRGNFQVTQAIRSQVLSRPWVTRAAVATKIAWAAGRAAAMPVVAGTLRVRKSKASGLTPGGLYPSGRRSCRGN